MASTVAIDCRPGGSDINGDFDAVVAVDVIRAATTAVTAVADGWRCFPVASLEAALSLSARLPDAILAGELGGVMPDGFEIQNSPSEVERRHDRDRPLILLSTSGTRVMSESAVDHTTYAACLRNASAQSAHVASRHSRVLIVGAQTGGDFREEDQLCCARIAQGLMEHGFRPFDARTEEVVERWAEAPDDAFTAGRSVEYLMRSGQQSDLDFILAHVDDVSDVFELVEGELVKAPNP